MYKVEKFKGNLEELEDFLNKNVLLSIRPHFKYSLMKRMYIALSFMIVMKLKRSKCSWNMPIIIFVRNV